MGKPVGRQLLSSRFFIVVLLISIALTVPAIIAGYMGDDYFFVGGIFPPDMPFGYYNFTAKNIDTEIQQWWTSPHFKMYFFRPLSSLSLHLDFSLFRGHPVLAHLQSVVWLVLLLGGAHLAYMRCFEEKTAKWATVLFAVSLLHSWSAGWVAARHAIMGSAFGMWALYVYLVRRAEGKGGGIFSPVLFVLGLLSSETALAFAGFAAAHALIYSSESRRLRLRAAAPLIGIALVYLVFYKVTGFGTDGSDAYTDPLSRPLLFLRMFVPKALGIFGATMLGVPGLLRMAPETVPLSNALGLSGLLLLGAGLLVAWKRLSGAEKRTVKSLGLAGTLGLFPGAAGAVMSQGREFALSGFAFLGIAAVVLTTLFSVKGSWKTRILPRAVAVLIFAGTLVFSPIARLGMGSVIYLHAEMSRQLGDSKTECKQGAHVLVLSGNFDVPIAYAPHLVAVRQGRFFKTWNQVAVTHNPIVVARPEAGKLVFSSKGSLVNTLLLREKDNPLAVRDIIERRPLTIEILETGADGPVRLSVTFRSQDIVNALCVLKTEKGLLVPATLPAVGQSMTVAYQPRFNR